MTACQKVEELGAWELREWRDTASTSEVTYRIACCLVRLGDALDRPEIYAPPTFEYYLANSDSAMKAIAAYREHLPGL